VPTHRLIARLGLTEWEHQVCPLDETDHRPAKVRIPLQQHIGAPAKPGVEVGDEVAVGDLIAQIPEGKLGANVHASIAGRVSSVDETAIQIIA
jgi:Na+-translocating ferredoxin:NAD+ oxidoreductase RnfC subunit